jgi:predicted nuclease with TOPRIM domain
MKESENSRAALEKFEKEEIQFREKLKHLQGKYKKLKKGIQQVK